MTTTQSLHCRSRHGAAPVVVFVCLLGAVQYGARIAPILSPLALQLHVCSSYKLGPKQETLPCRTFQVGQ